MGKKLFWLVLLISMTVTGVVNMSKQWHTLNEASKQNAKMEVEIGQLKVRNEEIKIQIEYATSSAALDQEAREKLGLGKANDSWLAVNKANSLNLEPEIKINKEIPKIREWISLFTH